MEWLSVQPAVPSVAVDASADTSEITLDSSFTSAVMRVLDEEHAPSLTWRWVHATVQAAIEENRQRQIAYHEAGHAVALHVLAPETVFTKISIQAEGDAGGHVAPDRNTAYEKVYLYSLEHAMETVVVALAGRAAEVYKFDACRGDSGAVSDIAQSTSLAWLAITAFGLDPEFGLVSLAKAQGLPASDGVVVPMAASGWLQDLAQKRLHAWMHWGMQEAKALISACWPLVDDLAQLLMKHKTLNNAQAREVLGRWRAGAPPYTLRPVPSSTSA
jgi:cell division protease FtsH